MFFQLATKVPSGHPMWIRLLPLGGYKTLLPVHHATRFGNVLLNTAKGVFETHSRPGHRRTSLRHSHKALSCDTMYHPHDQIGLAIMARIAYINLRVRPALKAKLEKLANQDRRSFSSYVKMVLEDHVKARQASSKGVERNRPKLTRRSDLRVQQ
jgi:hypothetical protein